MVAAGDHDLPSTDDGAAGRAELRRDLGGHLDIREAGAPVPSEERAAPALAPDKTHRECRAVFHLLVRPNLDVGLDDTALAQLAVVGDDHPLGQEGVGAHDRLPADHGLLDHGARTNLDAAPDDAAFDVGARVYDRLRPDDRIGDTRPGSDLGPAG